MMIHQFTCMKEEDEDICTKFLIVYDMPGLDSDREVEVDTEKIPCT